MIPTMIMSNSVETMVLSKVCLNSKFPLGTVGGQIKLGLRPLNCQHICQCLYNMSYQS
jgi:hypothetical protein